MAIETVCTGCGQRLRVAEQHIGKQARCPNCSNVYLVGGASAQGATQPLPLGSPMALSPESLPSEAPTSLIKSEHGSVPGANFFALTPDGTVYGPVDRITIERWTREGRLNESCRVRQGEGSPWQNMGQWLAAGAASFQAVQSLGTSSPLANTVAHPSEVNPFSDAAQPASNPYIATGQYPSYAPYPSDRSGVVLAMGILCWVLSCMYIGWIFAIIGVALAQQD